MVRTVRVRLELDREDYRRGLRDAANETRGFDGEVRAAGKDTAAMGVEVKSAGTQVEALGREADTAAKKTTALGDEAAKTKTKTTGLGDESDKTKAKIVDLAKEITTTKAALAALGDEFKKTGQVNVDELNKLSRSLRDLERAKTAMEKLIPGGGSDKKKSGGGLLDFALDEFVPKITKAAGGAIANGLESGVQSAGKAIASNPWIAAAVAAGITIGIPVIGAALTAAIGAGGIAGGVLLAAKDPRVGAAWSEFATSAKSSLESAASVFVDPLVRAATRFGGLMDNIMPSIRQDFASLAPVLDSLVNGVAGLVERMMPGINSMMKASGPILTQLAHDLPEVGAALGVMFKEIAGGSESGGHALHDLMLSIEGALITIGAIIWALEKWYGAERVLFSFMTGDLNGAVNQMSEVLGSHRERYEKIGPAAQTAFDTAKNAISGAGNASDVTAAQFQKMSGQISQTAINADTLAGQMAGKLLNSMMSLDQATLGFAKSQTSLADSIRQNGRELDIHTAKGEANRSAILAVVQSNMQAYQANIAVGMSAGDAAKAYDDNTAALERQLQKAGFTQAAIDGLIGKYRGVPAKVDTDIATKGLTEAINGLEDAIRLANHLNGRVVKLTVEEQHRTTYTNSTPPSQVQHGLAMGGIRAYAQGGIDYAAASGILTASDPGTILAAEPQTGGEALIPRLGISQGRAMSLASEVGDWHGFDVVPRQAPSYSAFAGARPMGYGGGTVKVELTMRAEAGLGGLEGPAASWVMGAIREGKITLTTDQGSKVRVG